MKFIVASAFLAALPAWVQAVLITNSDFDNIEAGKPFEITWSEATGPVTLTLKDGPSDNLVTVSQITSGATGESFTWTPSTSLPSGTYAIEINDGTDVNYSKQFEVTGGSASSSTSASSTASRTSSTVTSTTTSSETTSSASSTTSSTSESTSTSGTTSTSSSTRSSSTSSSSKTSAATSETVAPNTNAAQTMAPFVAPMLLAVGAVFM
ncbi:Ser-Thr-rich glycosyl-phosphatidyl-inositol-anchored membrane family-domain-containing protein [Hypomontagnella monticulosa]|nr:Ser-Thr-rich glycosyl-phosphatidyl-inositol-anchored membrane family-domain-containing protein [Hypomontagnella monticulosa]